jgi:DNA-binding NtrC family response regulator
MRPSPPSAIKIAILSANAADAANFRNQIESIDYRTETYLTLSDLKDGLAADPCMAVILDADSISLDNLIIRNLKARHPIVYFLLASRERFHPELQESISQILYACLKKPADFDEIHYLLKSIRCADTSPEPFTPNTERIPNGQNFTK